MTPVSASHRRCVVRGPMHGRGLRLRSRLAAFLAAAIGAALAVGVAPLAGQEGEAKNFKAVGTLGKNFKDSDFYEFTYFEGVGRKAEKKRAVLKIPSEVPLLLDKPAKLDEFKEGDIAFIYGKPEEREVVGNAGLAGVERFIRGALFLVGGEKIKVNREFKSPSPKETDYTWCEVEVEKSGGGANINVRYEKSSYFVTMERSAKIFVRAPVPDELREKSWKRLFRKGATLVVQAKATTESPESELPKRDAELPRFEVVSITFVDKSAMTSYGTYISLD